MRAEWLEFCVQQSCNPADFYTGARKIMRNVSFSIEDFGNDLSIEDGGYTSMKLTLLRNGYLHRESLDMAVKLWDRRCKQRKYGSVGFTTYNHLIKNSIEKKSKRASVMGPCIQSVVLTYMEDKTCEVDIFYRTTELFKKFPADLVFIRDELLSEFDFSTCPLRKVNFHFANLTCHPMYFVTLIPLLDNPVRTLNSIRRVDPYFHDWIVKWTARYMCEEHERGIQKFAQALRVKMDADKRITGIRRTRVVSHLRKYHPGHKNEYSGDIENEDE